MLDFCVVIIGLVSTANDLFASPDSEMLDLKSLRAARVVRPLKLVNGVPSKSTTMFVRRAQLSNGSTVESNQL
jgi:hypothetical protein